MTERLEYWQRTQLDYDGECWSYNRYTKAVIRRGHRLLVDVCERLAREAGGQATILDIGCAETEFYGKLAHVTGDYVGVEPSAVQVLRSEPAPNKYLMRGGGEHLALADGCIDIALIISVLDHCLDADATMHEAFRVLRPGGTVLILLENRGRFSNDIRAILNLDVNHGDEHLYYFSVDDLLALVRPLGNVSLVRSYGFALGLGWVSRVLPSSVVSLLNSMADITLGSIFKKKGQHFLVAVKKAGGQPAAPLAFRCPHCQASVAWSAPRCETCTRELSWIGQGILDTMGDAGDPS